MRPLLTTGGHPVTGLEARAVEASRAACRAVVASHRSLPGRRAGDRPAGHDDALGRLHAALVVESLALASLPAPASPVADGAREGGTSALADPTPIAG